MRKFFLSVLIFISFNTYAQSFKSSIFAEGSLLSTKTSGTEEKETVTGAGIYYSGKLRLSSGCYFEFRPGLFFTQMYYEGIVFGMYIRGNFSEKLFGVYGLNTYLNFNGPSNTYDPKSPAFSGEILVGYRLNDDFSVLLGIDKTFDSIYGHGSSSYSSYTKYLYWTAKLGVEYNL
jgi:hypothetical protein